MNTGRRIGKRLLCGLLLLFMIAAVGFGVLQYIGRRTFEVTFYQIESPKVSEKIRVIELADLHDWTFGKGNARLIDRIRALSPDVILIAGDMVMRNDSDVSSAVSLCRELVKIAPVYYTYGNHENELVYGANIDERYVRAYKEKFPDAEFEGRFDYERFEVKDSTLPDALNAAGVTILNNHTASLTIKGTPVDVAGVNTMSGSYYLTSAGVIEDFLMNDTDHVKLIIAHYPVIAFASIVHQEYLSFDAMVCGHRHGGIIRIPGRGGLIGSSGFFSFFEGYDAGLIKMKQGPVIISRGLGQSNLIPRVNNTPELVVIDIQ